jgi:CheY-like chemotaxis protein/DNA-directed RNA polymerase subunit RPC12/RpoP
MKCPKCSASFSVAPDGQGFYVCPECGSKLRSRGTTPVPVSAPAPAGHAESPNATLPAGTLLKPIPRPGDPAASLEQVLAEIRAVRRSQEELVAMLRKRPAASDEDDDAPPPQPAAASAAAAAMPPLRARRRKTVLLIDDDAETRGAALTALEQSQVPVRALADGNASLAAIAEEKPDVIVMELDVRGSMGGKDVINMIKATMEWVDIPVVLYTRLPIESQREARTIHGADELVPKGPGSAEALVARVISIFRRA